MNIFKVLLHPDQEELENSERTLVCTAANLIQIGEFQFLQVAYFAWHGSDLPESRVSQLFRDYMLQNRVPSWARHFARLVILKAGNGSLDPDRPEYHRYDNDYGAPVSTGMRRFVSALGIVVLILSATILAASQMTTDSSAILPPYFDQNEISPPRTENSGNVPSLE